MSTEVFTIKIAGPAGAGIKSAGLLLSKILLSHGLNTVDYVEYPSLVRGGHNTYQVSFSVDPIFASHRTIDLFFSLEPKHWQQHQSEFGPSSAVFGDDATTILPLKELSTQIGGKVYGNTICLGVACYLFNLDQKICLEIVSKNFGADSPNIKAFDLGWSHTQKYFSKLKFSNLKLIKNFKLKIKNCLYDGNESFGWGFIRGGGNFYSAYPMSPSSGALHFLASKQAEFNIKVIHPEDEIAAASLASGATFAGARSAVGTSGGGFALMTESVSFNGAAELGVVYYLVSRPGPATGLPTWTGQGDLLFAVHSGHGEFNKIVLAPANQQESHDLAIESLNLAAQFNVPVILLSDKFIAESSTSLPSFSQLPSPQIIRSSKPIPGTPGQEYMANSYEHDDQGFSVEDAPDVIKSVNVRLEQYKKIANAVPAPVLLGNPNANKLIVTFGSPASTILEALKIMDTNDYALLQIKSLWPLHPDTQKIISQYSDITVVENNAQSQLVSLLKSQFDFNPQQVLLKYDGRPFFPEELIALLLGILSSSKETKQSL